jgi:hypothetical protein
MSVMFVPQVLAQEAAGPTDPLAQTVTSVAGMPNERFVALVAFPPASFVPASAAGSMVLSDCPPPTHPAKRIAKARAPARAPVRLIGESGAVLVFWLVGGVL